jgi:hypothetical protein
MYHNKLKEIEIVLIGHYCFWIIIFLISLFFSFIVKYEEFQFQSGDLVVASILGYTFGALIFPAIIALIVGGVNKLFKKEFGKKSFRATFLTAWIRYTAIPINY